MKIKLFGMLTLLVIALWTTKVEACSGTDCGCEVPHAECNSECPTYPEPGSTQCLMACARAYKQCAIACCGRFFVAADAGGAGDPEQIHCSMQSVASNGIIKIHPKPPAEGGP